MNHYEIPNWAGKAPAGLHLDITKDQKLIHKLMIDQKKCYLFGRNPQLNDVCIDHGSCSRVHAALVYHKNLNMSYLVDLGSTHGTFIGALKLEAHKPTPLQVDSIFRFGASTRNYAIKERVKSGPKTNFIMEDIPQSEATDALGLPDTQTDLDDLTEYNTAHNRRISMLGITDDSGVRRKAKRKKRSVTFNDEEIIINPEDVDPAVGRFRNLIQSTIIPAKRSKGDGQFYLGSTSESSKSSNSSAIASPSTAHSTALISSNLYQDVPPVVNKKLRDDDENMVDIDVSVPMTFNTTGALNNILPNPAPDVMPSMNESYQTNIIDRMTVNKGAGTSKSDYGSDNKQEAPKKKYVKEIWPGRSIYSNL